MPLILIVPKNFTYINNSDITLFDRISSPYRFSYLASGIHHSQTALLFTEDDLFIRFYNDNFYHTRKKYLMGVNHIIYYVSNIIFTFKLK